MQYSLQEPEEFADCHQAREFEGIAAAAKRFGLKSDVVVTHEQSDQAVYDGCEISIVPAFEYLLG